VSDRIGPDDEERLERHARRLGVPRSSIRLATRAEVAELREELDRRYLLSTPRLRDVGGTYWEPSYPRDRLRGAAGD
jgi:hypothetical protein